MASDNVSTPQGKSPQNAAAATALTPKFGLEITELALLIRLKYLTEVNRWTTLYGAPVALLQEATGGDPSRSLL